MILYSFFFFFEIDPVTGFNSINEFYEVIKEEFTNAQHNKLNLSLLIVEMSNSDAIAEQFTMRDALLMVKQIA